MIKSFFKGIILAWLTLTAMVFAVFFVGNFIFQTIAPKPEILALPILPESSKIYDRNGKLLYEIYKEERREPVKLEQIAVPLRQAMIAVEDKDFYQNPGLSASGVVRSFIYDVANQKALAGGSTITQQVVKNTFKLNEKTLARKTSEAVWSLSANTYFTKDQILEMYLNSVPFGRNTYGAEAAAQSYFGKSAVDLTLTESAYLAAIPRNPNIYSPDNKNREQLEARKNFILSEMFKDGYINILDLEKAQNETITFLPNKSYIKAPYFVMWVKQQLIQKYGEDKVYNGGLKVYTSLDLDLQNLAESSVASFSETNNKKYHASNAGLVAVEPKTGQVLAMVGGKDYFASAEPQNCQSGVDCTYDPNTNVALALRQPGSSFKPYVYVTAFSPEFKFNTGSIVLDVGKNFAAQNEKAYIPKNYNGGQYGRVSLRKALAGSLNIATVRLTSEIGTDSIIKTANSLNLKGDFKNCGLALALGSCEISLLDHTAAFATFANSGNFNTATNILKITDKYDQTLVEYKQESKPVLDPQAVYELDSILSDSDARAFVFGKNLPLTLPDRKVIVKTGTTQNWRDGWTVGGTPNIVAGVWVGNNNGELMAKGADGVFVAAPIWQKFMLAASTKYEKTDFVKPEGIAELKINRYTGLVAQAGQSYTNEVSASYAIPQEPQPKKIAVADAPPEDLPIFAEAKIVEPKNGQVLSLAQLNVEAVAEKNYGTRVTLFLDDQPLQTVDAPNFSWAIASNLVTPGQHKLSIVAVNQQGYRSQDSVDITISGNIAALVP